MLVYTWTGSIYADLELPGLAILYLIRQLFARAIQSELRMLLVSPQFLCLGRMKVNLAMIKE